MLPLKNNSTKPLPTTVGVPGALMKNPPFNISSLDTLNLGDYDDAKLDEFVDEKLIDEL